jgi:ribonuclease HI
MNIPTPHYLLTAETSRTEELGDWRFVLRPTDGQEPIEVADIEPDVWGERLDLLTVVRALESLDQPSRVTVVQCTRYVQQGIAYGIVEWRENGWRWESFGQMVPVRDADLWQRMDRALQFHEVNCGHRRFDPIHSQFPSPHNEEIEARTWADCVVDSVWVKYHTSTLVHACKAYVDRATLFLKRVLGHREGLGARG